MMKAFLIPFLMAGASLPGASGKGYDLLAVDAGFRAESRELKVHDAARNRDIPVRIYLPANEKPEPVVLFSHGLGGSRAGSGFLGEHWAARGYVAVFVQHPGSDDAVWKEAAPGERMAALREAASLENFWLRVKDVAAVIDQLEAWNKTGPLAGRMDLTKIGMSGHSFRRGDDRGGERRDVPDERNEANGFSDSRGRYLQSEHAGIDECGTSVRRGEDPMAVNDRNKGHRSDRPGGYEVAAGGLSRAARRPEVSGGAEQRGAFRIYRSRVTR